MGPPARVGFGCHHHPRRVQPDWQAQGEGQRVSSPVPGPAGQREGGKDVPVLERDLGLLHPDRGLGQSCDDPLGNRPAQDLFLWPAGEKGEQGQGKRFLHRDRPPWCFLHYTAFLGWRQEKSPRFRPKVGKRGEDVQGVGSLPRCLSWQMPWVMVPMGQNAHQVRGR